MHRSAPTLPDGGVLLHIGPHKTGTTAIQGALAAARPRLVDAGISYPGRRHEHNRAAAAAIGRAIGWDGKRFDTARWSDLVDHVHRQASRRIVISSEVFCEASPAAIRTVVDDLGAERVHVAVSLRPLERLLPSSWQQYLKSGYRISYEDWLADALESRDRRPVTPSFWLRNNHAALLNRWLDVVGDPERIVVVVVDAARPRNLFDSFEQILALPQGFLQPASSSPSNRSLTAAEAELLRNVNMHARPGIASKHYGRLMKRGAVRLLVEERVPPSNETRVATPAWAIARAREFSVADVAAIRASGVQVIGDLDTLAPTGPIPDDATPAVCSVPIDLAATLLWDLLSTASLTLTRVTEAEVGATPEPIVQHRRGWQIVAKRLHGYAKRALTSRRHE